MTIIIPAALLWWLFGCLCGAASMLLLGYLATQMERTQAKRGARVVQDLSPDLVARLTQLIVAEREPQRESTDHGTEHRTELASPQHR